MTFHRGFLPALLASVCALSLAQAVDQVPGIVLIPPTVKPAVAVKQLPLMKIVKTLEPPRVDGRAARDSLQVALSPDDKILVIANGSHLSARDVETEREIWKLDLPQRDHLIGFTPDGKGLLVAHDAGQRASEVLTLEPETGETIRHAEGPMNGTGNAIASADGKILLVGGGSGFSDTGEYVMLVNAFTGKPLVYAGDEDGKTLRGWTYALAFLSGEKHFATSLRSQLLIHDTESGKVVKRLEMTKAFRHSPFLAANEDIIVAGSGEGIAAIDINRMATLWQIAYPDQNRFFQAQFVSGGGVLAWGKDVSLLDAATGEEMSWAAGDPFVFAVSVGTRLFACVEGSTKEPDAVMKITLRALPTGAADPNEKVDPKSLLRAAERGNAQRVRAMIARGADVRTRSGPANGFGDTPLHLAATAEVASALLDGGADVDAVSSASGQRTPLQVASSMEYSRQPEERIPLIDVLLAHGAKIDAHAKGYTTALQDASRNGLEKVARHLLEKGATYDIFSAVSLKDPDQVRKLLKTQPELANIKGWSLYPPLFFARDRATVDALIEGEADLQYEDRRSYNLAGWLQGNNAADLADYVVSKGAPAAKRPK